MAKKKGYRRRHTTIGVGTVIGATVAAAGVLNGQYDIPFEIQSAMKGEQGAGQVLGKMVENVKTNAPLIIMGLAIPAIAKKLLPNPSVYVGKKVIVKAM